MAIGDKKSAVMQNDIVNDFTTGGATNVLSAEMGKSLAQRPNPNLLDNWYFTDPIDQRGGYVYPPNMPYADIGGNQIGLTSKYITIDVSKKNPSFTDWAEISIDGTTYYGYIPYAVRGYTGAGYTIDRWRISGLESVLLIADDCLTFYGNTQYANFGQIIGNAESFVGKTMTLSVLRRETNANTIVGVLYGEGFSQCGVSASKLISHTFTIPDDASGNLIAFIQHIDDNNISAAHNFVAAKLELGTQQTLAHQDVNGNWVLNDAPPNFALELLKCQRYFVRISPSKDSQTIANGIIDSSLKIAWMRLNLPVQLRINTPGISVNKGSRFTVVNSATYIQTPLSGNPILYGLTCNEIQLGFPVSNANFDAKGYCTFVMDTNSYIDIIAEL